MNEKVKATATSIGRKAVAWLTSKGWGTTLAKVAVGAVLGAAVGIAAALGLTGCHGASKSTVASQLQRLETVYTTLGGTVNYRIVPVETSKK